MNLYKGDCFLLIKFGLGSKGIVAYGDILLFTVKSIYGSSFSVLEIIML